MCFGCIYATYVANRCRTEVDWMHCKDIVNPLGTWRETWHALEKAYAEGMVQSIGVSNFNVHLLREIEERVGVILPHVVQNWSDLSNMDSAVREWCQEREVIYQPYATNRNLHTLREPLQKNLQIIAADRQVTPQYISNQFYLQTGAVIIPRSTKYDHLKENLEIAEWMLTEDEFEMLGWKL